MKGEIFMRTKEQTVETNNMTNIMSTITEPGSIFLLNNPINFDISGKHYFLTLSERNQFGQISCMLIGSKRKGGKVPISFQIGRISYVDTSTIHEIPVHLFKRENLINTIKVSGNLIGRYDFLDLCMEMYFYRKGYSYLLQNRESLEERYHKYCEAFENTFADCIEESDRKNGTKEEPKLSEHQIIILDSNNLKPKNRLSYSIYDKIKDAVRSNTEKSDGDNIEIPDKKIKKIVHNKDLEKEKIFKIYKSRVSSMEMDDLLYLRKVMNNHTAEYISEIVGVTEGAVYAKKKNIHMEIRKRRSEERKKKKLLESK